MIGNQGTHMVRSALGTLPLLSSLLSIPGNDKHSLLLNECHLLHLNLIVFLTNLIIKIDIKSLLLLKQIVPYNCALMVGSGFTEKNEKMQDKNAF